MKCDLCPRGCSYEGDRRGFCTDGKDARVAKIMLHHFEEPCISGGEDGAGSGAIFFTGCSLKCVYCQNGKISRSRGGEVMSPERLAEEILRLQDEGAYNVNLVTPTHFTDRIIEALDIAKGRLRIPVVWNTSGYETPENIARLKGYVDIYLTDFKYASSELSAKYSAAPDYARFAAAALAEMVKTAGEPVYDGELMMSGVIVRHLVLPGAYRDSVRVLETVADTVGAYAVVLSLMAQYTPEFLTGDHPELKRRITSFEYDKVLKRARELGFSGYMQSRSSADASFTPDF